MTAEGRGGKFDYLRTYRSHVDRMTAEHPDEGKALEAAVGGEFEAMGRMMVDLLVSQGLRPDSDVIDVGCGSGRLALPLSRYLVSGTYLGTDVVPQLIERAQTLVGRRPDWRFEVVEELRIPAVDASADLVCFFSVITHLRHEESFRYLQEAARVLRPGGAAVFSFLEFAVPAHWVVFESNLTEIDQDTHLNQFVSRDAIEAWVAHLPFELAAVFPGDVPYIPLSDPVHLDSGQVLTGFGSLGQSVAVLTRRET